MVNYGSAKLWNGKAFVFQVPIRCVKGGLMTMITDNVVEGTRMDTKKTIMVVDDNPDIITIVKTILEGRGYTVYSASSGPELLTLLPNQKPDLIILDIMMPEMDGLEVLTRLKGKNETASIPVILLTAKVQYEDVLGGYKLGADYYITKPFTSTQLVNGINLLLGEGKA
jgi:CheY-like chemotaxis protein